MFKSLKSAKKGIMFTVMSVLVCALIITSFFTFQSVSLDSDVENVKLRVKGIDRFVNDADSYVGGLAHVSGKSTLDFTLDLMIGNNSFLPNYTNEFKSCLMTGNMSVPWSASPVNCPEKSYLARTFSSFENFSNSNLNLESKITLNGVNINQEDPWNIIVYVNYTIVIKDSYAFWNETRVTKGLISVAGLRDPTYAIVNGTELSMYRDKNHIINTSYVEYWSEVRSTANSVVVNGSYFEWIGAPSYLERMEGIKNVVDEFNFSGSNGATCITGVGRCGIVSIVPVFSIQQMTSLNQGTLRSNLDFEFWNNLSMQGQEISYGRYDFWQTYNFDYFRTFANITPTNANTGLNGTIIPVTLMEHINMSNLAYVSSIN